MSGLRHRSTSTSGWRAATACSCRARLRHRRAGAPRSVRSRGRRCPVAFSYHPDHDAWHVRRTSGCGRSRSTRSNRVMRYRGHAVGLQRLPGQGQLHDLLLRARGPAGGRPVAGLRGGRFHRGIACCGGGARGLPWPLGTALAGPGADSCWSWPWRWHWRCCRACRCGRTCGAARRSSPRAWPAARSTTQSPSGSRLRRPDAASLELRIGSTPDRIGGGQMIVAYRRRPGAAARGWCASLRVLQEYERGVVFRLGGCASRWDRAVRPGCCPASTSWSGWTCGWSR